MAAKNAQKTKQYFTYDDFRTVTNIGGDPGLGSWSGLGAESLG